MRGILKGILVLFLLFTLVSCDLKEGDGLIEYRDTYTEEDSGIFNLLLLMPEPNGELLDSYELETAGDTEGLTLYYKKGTRKDSDKGYPKHEQIIMYNSYILFSLIENIDYIDFQTKKGEYLIQRQELEDYLQEDPKSIMTQEELFYKVRYFVEQDDFIKDFFH